MAHDVFLSYSANDKATADAACATLEQAGIRCWVAPRDVAPGHTWAESILAAIAGSRVMVLVLSVHANSSSHVMREVERAVSRGIPIIPLRVDDVTPSGALEYFISTSHWLDAMTPPLERHLKRLAETVAVLLAHETASAGVQDGPPDSVGGISPKGRTRVGPWTVSAVLLAVVGLGSFLTWAYYFRPRSPVSAEQPPSKFTEGVDRSGAPPAPDVGGPSRQASPGAAATSLHSSRAAGPGKPAVSLVEDSTNASIRWALLPGGEFQMGCVEEDSVCTAEVKVLSGFPDRHGVPRHLGRVDPFRIMTSDVTVAQFRVFVDATHHVSSAEKTGKSRGWTGSGWNAIPGLSWRKPGFSQGEDHPVVHVSWFDAAAFCGAMAARLPTEAEWEYAARGGLAGAVYGWGNTKTPLEGGRKLANVGDETAIRKFALGETSHRFSNYDDGFTETSPVGTFAPNGFGLTDMTGNVLQWTSSEPRPYPYRKDDGREVAPSDEFSFRIVRGGAWYPVWGSNRVAFRDAEFASTTQPYVGFRCAKSGR